MRIRRSAVVLAGALLISGCGGSAVPALQASHPAAVAIASAPAGAKATARLDFTFPNGTACNRYGYVPRYLSKLEIAVNGKSIQSYDISGFTAVSETFSVPSGDDRFAIKLWQGTELAAVSYLEKKVASGTKVSLVPKFGGVPVHVALSTPQLDPPTGQPADLVVSVKASDNSYNEISCGGPFSDPIVLAVKDAGKAVSPKGATLTDPGEKAKFTYDGSLLDHTFTISALQVKSYPLTFVTNPYVRYKLGYAAVAFARGANGAIWYSHCKQGAQGPCQIRKVNPDGSAGVVKPFFPFVQSLAVGPDNNIWFAEGYFGHKDGGGVIGRVDPASGAYKTFAIPKGQEPDVVGLVNGPGDRLWFQDSGYVGNITTDGTVREYYAHAFGSLTKLIVGSDNRVYFLDDNEDVCAMDLAGKRTCYTLPQSPTRVPSILMWYRDALFLNLSTGLATLSTKGKIAKLGTSPFTPLAVAQGQLWGTSTDGGLSRLTFANGKLTGVSYAYPSSGSGYGVESIVPASDRHLWIVPGDLTTVERFQPAI